MKYWHETYPTRFGVIFFLVYGLIDVVDARVFIPRKVKEPRVCEMSVSCENWLIIKEKP